MTDSPTDSCFSDRNSRSIVLAVSAGLVLITLLAFFGVWQNEFVDYDDNTYVYRNPHVSRGMTWETVVWASTFIHSCHWVPLTWLSHALDCELFGLKPGGHHLTSLLLHVTNVGLLFLLLHSMSGPVWRSAIVSVFFGLHPLRVESVAWVAERKDVLSGFFFLLTLILYVRHVQKLAPRSPPGSAWIPRSNNYWFALFFFACGLMSKPMLVTVPCLLLLLDYWPLHRLDLTSLNPSSLREKVLPLIQEKIPFFILSGIISAVTFLAQESTIGSSGGGSTGIPFDLRVSNAVVACVNYLWLTVWPTNLAVFYPVQHLGIFSPVVIGAVLILAVMTIIALRTWAGRPYVLVGWFWFLGMLVPVSGIVQAGDMIQADRFTYLPSIGLGIMVVWAIASFAAERRRLQAAMLMLAILVIAAFGVATQRQVRVWRNTETLFRHAAAVTRDNHVALATLADIDLAAGRVAESAATAERILKISPGYPRGECLMAAVLQRQGRMQEAIPHLERSYGPEVLIPSRARLVLSFIDGGRLSEAEALLNQLLQVMPNNPDAWLMQAALLREQGRTTEAVELFRKVTQSYTPTLQDTPLFNYEIAELFSISGPSIKAVEFYAKAVADFPNFTNALNSFAWLLATDPVADVRNGTLAVQCAERACELSQWKQPVFMGTLAAAYAEAGRFDDAVKMAARARDKAKALGAEAIASRNAELLNLYQQGRPYREPSQ